jgi:hypothetical protein
MHEPRCSARGAKLIHPNLHRVNPNSSFTSVQTPSGPRLVLGPRLITQTLYGGELLSLPEGNYARLVVSDAGTGMDADTRAMSFMAFWTTRAVGKGSWSRSLYGVLNRQQKRRLAVGGIRTSGRNDRRRPGPWFGIGR